KDPKPELQVNPLSQVLELFGTLGPEEQLWTQIIFRVTKGEAYRGKKNAAGKNYTWRDEGAALIKSVREGIKRNAADLDPRGEGRGGGLMNATKAEKEKITAIERNTGKAGFDVGMRSIYSAPEGKYQTMNPFVANIWKAFGGWSPITPAPLWSEKY